VINEFNTMQKIVYNTIKRKIVTGVYEPKQRLIAHDLAEEFNVSRTPVREALARLASIGLVELIPYKGAIVNELTAEDYCEIFHIRSVLEGLAMRLACPNLIDDDLKKMRTANEEVRDMIDKDDIEFQRVNRTFHSIIWKRAGSERLQKLLSNLYFEASQYRQMVVVMPGRLKEIYEEHENILDALYKQDPKLAEERARSIMKIRFSG